MAVAFLRTIFGFAKKVRQRKRKQKRKKKKEKVKKKKSSKALLNFSRKIADS
ncbi:MAG: hypothetical protein R3Y27_06435 [Clostridia bacterium]